MKCNGECRILTVLVDIVHTRFGIAERSLTTPAISQHTETFIDEAFVPQCTKRPHDAFHVGSVKSLVIICKINPACLARDIPLPLVGITQHTCTTCVIELVDTKRSNRGVTSNTEFFFCFYFGRQSVAVPTESSFYVSSAHRLITRHSILDESCEQVTVMWQSICERRAVIKNEFVVTIFTCGASSNTCSKGIVAFPPCKDPFFHRWEVRLRVNVGVCHAFRLGVRWASTQEGQQPVVPR